MWVENTVPSCRDTVILVDQPAEHRATPDPIDRNGARRRSDRIGSLKVDPSVRAVRVVVVLECGCQPEKPIHPSHDRVLALAGLPARLQQLRCIRRVSLSRDPRGVAYSWTKQVEKEEVSGRTELMLRCHPARMACRWTMVSSIAPRSSFG